MAKRKRHIKVPGTIYKNGNRYWWKVQLPAENKPQARPLRPVGGRYATKDYNEAIEVARIIWQRAMFQSNRNEIAHIETIGDLAAKYMCYAEEYYGSIADWSSVEPFRIKCALRSLIELYPQIPPEDFSPLKLKKVRDQMIKKGLARKTINNRVSTIKRMFKWAVSEELTPASTYQALLTVEGLRRGRSKAKDTPPVKAIDEKYVRAILPYTTPVVAAMVELQMLTGMRSGELVRMRPCDIERGKAIWHYYPEKHKNKYRGIPRVVSIGPRGQEILHPFLLRNPKAFCFSPQESEKQRRAKMSAERQTPLHYGNRPGTNCKDAPQRQPSERYDSTSYRKAIKYAIRSARQSITARGADPDTKLPKWTPHQLRHTAATKARKMFNYETAGALLGHLNMSATAIYAERNQGLADEAAKKFG